MYSVRDTAQAKDVFAAYTVCSIFPTGRSAGGRRAVFRDLAKPVALVLSIVSLYALLGSVFFVPANPWQQQILGSLETLAMSACVCFASGLLLSLTTKAAPPVSRTLPVQLFFWSLGGMVLIFLLSRYLEVFYIPTIWKNQPYWNW